MRHLTMLAALAACGAMLALAPARAAPAALHADQTVAIDAPPARVWSIVRNFADLTWHPAVKNSTATDGNKPGSVRTLDLGGPKLTEELVVYDPKGMLYTYRITDDPANVKVLPVTEYVSTISVRPGTDKGSVVEWQGTFMRADHSDAPAPGQDDAAAVKAISGVYAGGLAHLKEVAEAH